jgi:hypothetical protein
MRRIVGRDRAAVLNCKDILVTLVTIYPKIFKSVLSALKTGQNDSKVSNVRSGTCRYCNRSVAAMESAVLSQIQQDADARGCRSNSVAVNASLGRCVKPDLQAENADESDDEEEEDDE